MSLGARGNVLRDLNRTADAAATFHEGIECLKQHFLQLPLAFRPLMKALVGEYLQACESSGTEPDYALLAEILPRLADTSPPQ
jgi:hypothetical protein